MKFRILFAGILATAAVLACKKEAQVTPELDLEKTSIEMYATEALGTFYLTTNQSWTATADAAWLSMNPNSGEGTGTPIEVTVTAEDNTAADSRIATITITAGNLVKTIDVTQRGVSSDDPGEEGAGSSAEDPIVLSTADDLKNMGTYAVADATVYFSLANDIDMASVTEWVPVNYGDAACTLHFEGNNHTISNFTCPNTNDYASFFGVLTGSVKNVTFATANINSNGKQCGVIAGILKGATLENCHATGVTITCATDLSGGLAGQSTETCSITRCSVAGEVNGKQYVGGILGENKGTLTISDCYSTCNVIGTGQQVGGILGRTISDGSSANVSRCYSSGDITALRDASGIVGSCITKSVLTIENCIAWNNTLTATGAENKHYFCGAIRGGTQNTTTVTSKNCIRKSTLTISTDADQNVISDCENEENATGAANVAYHGKAAAADATLSSVATSLGWSAEVWDLTGEIPTLK